jgi:hypothetical protein
MFHSICFDLLRSLANKTLLKQVVKWLKEKWENMLSQEKVDE